MFLPPLAPTLDAAVRDARAKNPRFRLAAAERLSDAPPDRADEAAEALRVLLDDELGPIRAAAARALGELGAASAREALTAALDDPHVEVREAALAAAARLDPEPTWLEARLTDPRPELRFEAVVALAEHLPARAVEALPACLEDDDAAVRAAAARSLGVLGAETDPGARDDETTRDALAARLDDAHAVRAEAALALARLGDRRARPVLARLVGDRASGRPYAIEAAEALGSLEPTPETVEALADVAERFFTPLLVRAAVGAALARLGDPRGEVALERVLRARRADGRDYAVRAAGELRLAGLLPALARLARRLRGADPRVLAGALERFADDETARRARALLQPRLATPEDA